MFGMLPFERSDDNLFDTFDNFTRNFFRGSNASLPAFRTDIRDAGDKFVLEAELPGFDKGDIKLDVKDGILTITAEHSENQEQKDAKGAYIRRERRYGSFSRSFDITGIDEGSITAAYNNGILELNLPKAVPVVPESRRIALIDLDIREPVSLADRLLPVFCSLPALAAEVRLRVPPPGVNTMTVPERVIIPLLRADVVLAVMNADPADPLFHHVLPGQ